tara:strand:- start:31 stop:444 length:414 start_codon:yes stop_codon:yes gene_type:complete
MQTVITYLLFLIAGTAIQAQNTIEVSLTEIDNDKGTVKVGLYNEESTFLDKTYKSLSSEISNQKANVTFNDVPDGIYAISSFHDADDDRELKMFLGMVPLETYGCSNGAKGYFGPPKWEDAKFEVKDGEVRKLEIKL